MNMKSVCTPQQQEQLTRVFKAMLNPKSNMGMPNQGRRNRPEGNGNRNSNMNN